MDFRNMAKTVERWTTLLFLCASIFVMLLLAQALILTWLSQFRTLYLAFSVFIAITLTIMLFKTFKKDIDLLPAISIPVLVIIIFICLLGVFFPHETFGGRDEGSYSNMAVMLSKNGTLFLPSYILTTVGNWGGFDTQRVISFSTPAYYVWLGIQNSFFGPEWLLKSNVILIFLGFCSLFLVSFSITKKSSSFITVALFSSCLPFLWFFRETMSENLSFFLLWTSLVFFISFFETRKGVYLIGLFLGTWLFAFTRLEGMFIQLTTFFVFASLLIISKKIISKQKTLIILIYLAIIGSVLLISNPFENNSFLRKNVGIVEFLFKRSISSIPITKVAEKNNEALPKKAMLTDKIPAFIEQMLAKYNLVIILFSIFLIIPLIALDKKMNKKNKIYFFCLLIILSPEFYKFIDPAVSLDQPWLYRRYVYALLPMGYLCFAILLNKLMTRKLMLIVFATFFITNITLSSRIIFLKNNWSLTEQVEKLFKNISPKEDFVIVKEWTTLNNYYPTNYLTFQKGIRALVRHLIDDKMWFIGEKKYMGIPYNKLFLLSDKEPESYKNFQLVKVNTSEINYTQLDPNCVLPVLNSELGLNTSNLYSLPLNSALTYCAKTDNEILNVSKKIFLYELFAN